MFNFTDLVSSIKEVQSGVLITEAFSFPDTNTVRKNLSVPDMRPGLFDGTVDAWLTRISLWGKVDLDYYDPEARSKKKLNRGQFVKKLTEPNFLKVFGKWETEKLDVNKLVIYRDYVGLNGKKYREKFFVTIHLKKELKMALR